MLDSQLHFLLLCCYHNSARLIAQRTQALGLLSGQPKILECLRESDGRTPKEMGRKCGLDKSTITSLLGKMEHQGLIRRETHATDKRSVRIYLTEEGKEKAEQVEKICLEVDRRALEAFSPEEREELLGSLRNVLGALEGISNA